jgi:hypothetical protein
MTGRAMNFLNFKRGFNRLFAVLTLVWALYCIFGVPLQQGGKAFDRYNDEVKNCGQLTIPSASCFDEANDRWASAREMWSYKLISIL